jgi:hypothetical protein
MDSLFELEEVEEIKECPRRSNKGIESIIIQIALQVTQLQTKYLSSPYICRFTFCMYIILIESS